MKEQLTNYMLMNIYTFIIVNNKYMYAYTHIHMVSNNRIKKM